MGKYELTNPQKSIWYTEEVFKGSNVNNICTSGTIYENVDIELLKKAINTVVEYNDSFRIHINIENGITKQYISDYKTFNIDVEFINDASQLKQIQEKQAKYSFNIIDSDLFKFKIAILKDKFACVILTANHIISDSWSMGLTIQEILRIYNSLKNGERLEVKTYSYIDYIKSEQEYKASEKYIKDKKYWEDCFETLPEQVTIPSQSNNFVGITCDAKRLNFSIDKEIVNKINIVCKENHFSAFNFILAIYSIYIGRVNNADDFIIGTPILNRANVKEKHTTGMFINTAPIRFNNISGSFANFANSISQKMIGILRHQRYSYNSILEDLRSKYKNVPNLYNIMISYQVTKAFDKKYGNYETSWTFSNECPNDLDIHIYDINDTGNLEISYDYLTNKYNENDINILHTRITNMINQVLKNIEIPASEINIITEEEKNKIIYEFNNTNYDYPKDKTIVDLFEEQVEKTPDNIAVVFGEEKLTYRELNEKANSLANYLKKQGIKKADIVPIFMDRTTNLVISMLAIIKLGAVYLPISPETPVERTKYIVQNSNSKYIITDISDLNISDIEIVDISNFDCSKYQCTNLNIKINPSDLLYIIYTSGSTGNPKGVKVCHKNLVNFVFSFTKLYGNITSSDRLLASTSISFDVSIFELFMPLLNGFSLYLYNEPHITDVYNYCETIKKNKITFAYIPPNILEAVYNILSSSKKIALNKLLFGVEPIKSEVAEKFYSLNPNLKIINAYGPTETTICATAVLLNNYVLENYDILPIGRPLNNLKLYILDKNMQPVPIGISGELYISGDNVSKGYLKNTELTKASFISIPHLGCELAYKTGDLAKWDKNGYINFIGRNDNQVKMNGYRIETEEISSLILKYPNIKKSYVAKHSINNREFLSCYFVADTEISIKDLKKYLSQKLPQYMIPLYFIHLEDFPYNHNGKIDKKKLPVMKEQNEEKEIVLPRNETDSKLIDILKNIFNIDIISLNDDFFELGGDSLSAINLSSFVKSIFNVELFVKDILEHSQVQEISDIIQKKIDTYTEKEIIHLSKSEYYPVSSAQKRIYFASQVAGSNSILYNIPGGVILDEYLDEEKLENCFKTIIDRHKTLRTFFDTPSQNTLVQKIIDKIDFNLDILKNVDFSELENLFKNFIKPFDLKRAPLFRAKYIEFTNGKSAILIDMHHIISDGTSMNIFIDEICKLYNGDNVPNLKIDYKDYSVYENKKLESNEFKNAENYWISQFNSEIPVLNLPLSYSRPAVQNFEGAKIHSRIDANTTTEIHKISSKLGITPYMFLLSCYYILLSKYTSQDDIIVGAPVIGRDIADTYNLIGMFVNTLAFRNKIDVNLSFKDFALNIKDKLLEAYKYQTYPFDELVNKLHLQRDTSRNPLFDTMFIYQNNGYKKFNLNGINAQYFLPDTNISKFDLSVEAVPNNNDIILTFEYATSLFNKEFIKNLTNHYLNIVKNTVNNIDTKISDINMLSHDEENKILYDFNDTVFNYPKKRTVVDLFEEQVKKTPDNVAVVFENKELTYKELNERANQLAYYLRNKEKIGRNDIVGVMCNRSLEMIISILAVLKSGGAYIPIDPTYPSERVNYMLKNSASKVLLTLKNSAKGVYYPNKIFVDLEDNNLYTTPAQNLDIINKPEDLAYVIYTSGSTGLPKGVMITHKVLINFTNYCNNYVEYLKNPVYQSIVSITTVSFDIFFYETIISLQKGLKLVIANEAEQNTPNLLNDLIKKFDVKILQSTPSRMQIFINNIYNMPDLKNLKYIILAGEQLPLGLVNSLHNLSNITVYNGYGPSETFFCTLAKMNNDFITIGKPIYNTQMYILDKNLRPVPIGVIGEIYIAGEAVGKGYLNNEDLTSKSFIKNPFIPNNTMYKTGDLGMYMSDGNIICLGRTDHQIKIRGLRIELEEIEELLLKYSNIKSVAVVKQTINTREFISCYYVADKRITTSELRKYLSQKLPRYMIPSYFVALNNFPYTPNGKIDRKALPLPQSVLNISKEDYLPPKTKLQKQLVQIWEKILNTKPVGINDNFFELGGDSLLAMNLNIELIKISNNISYSDIFRFPTISEMEEKIISNDNSLAFNKIENLSDSYIDILKNCTKKDKQKRYHPKNILLTGSTGYLGIHILDEFIKKEKGNIYCIVRNSPGITVRTRLYQKLNYYFGNKYDNLLDKRIFAIPGNISEPGFGLNQEDLLNLANSVDVVINSAAIVSHFGNYNEFYKSNVTSVKYIIDFCKSFKKKMYHISTIGVAGTKLDLSYPSNSKNNTVNFYESSLYVGQILDNVYTRSKFEAESLVLSAINNGLDGFILRMGHLTPRLKDGVFQENAMDNELLLKISSFANLRFVPDYLLNYSFDFTPVDCAARSIYKIVTHPTRKNRIFNLYNHHTVIAKNLLKILQKQNYKINVLQEKDFIDKVNNILQDENSKNLLNNLIDDFDKDLHLDYNSNIIVKSDFTIKYLRRTYFKWPRISNKYLIRFINLIRKEK